MILGFYGNINFVRLDNKVSSHIVKVLTLLQSGSTYTIFYKHKSYQLYKSIIIIIGAFYINTYANLNLQK